MTTMTASTHSARCWDRIAERYARKPVPIVEDYEIKLQKTRDVLQPTDRVLEIGCGTGSTAMRHANDAALIHSVDVSPEMVRIATEKARAASIENVTFEVSDIASLPVSDDRYDVIMAHSVLHLLPDLPTVFRQLRHLLKPGGLLIANSQCIGDTAPWFGFIAPIGRALRLLPPIAIFKEDDYRAWMTDAGFDVQEWWQPRAKASIYSIARSVE